MAFSSDVDLPKLLVLEYNVDLNNTEQDSNLMKLLQHVRPHWPPGQIKTKVFTDGITNKLIGCYLAGVGMGDTVLIRVNGEGTEAIIDRAAEVNTFKLLQAAGIGPPLYAIFANGISYGFAQGAPLDEKLVREKTVATLIAKEMARLHNVQPDDRDPAQRESLYKVKATAYLNAMPTGFDDEDVNARFLAEVPSLSAMATELENVCSELEGLEMAVVFSHNDLLLKNIIYDSKAVAIHFIDVEYATLNYQAYDIGNHFCEYAGVDTVDYNLYPDKVYQLKWLRVYLQADFKLKGKSPEDVTDRLVERLYVQTNKCACAAHFFWAMWALIQAKNSSIDFDFLGYAITRLNEYYRRKKEFFPLPLPSKE